MLHAITMTSFIGQIILTKGAMDSFRTTMASTDREWRSQLLQTNQHQEKMTSLLPWIDTYINCVTKTVAKDVDSMRTKTAYMVQHFGSLCEEFRKVLLRSMLFILMCLFLREAYPLTTPSLPS
jgi:hypothetical protein